MRLGIVIFLLIAVANYRDGEDWRLRKRKPEQQSGRISDRGKRASFG